MSAALRRVEPVQCQTASRVIGETVADRQLTAAWQLIDELDATAGMAGSDSAGSSWAGGYDQAARESVSTAADVGAGLLSTGESISTRPFRRYAIFLGTATTNS